MFKNKKIKCEFPKCSRPSEDTFCDKFLCFKHLPSPDQGFCYDLHRELKEKINDNPKKIKEVKWNQMS